MQSAKLKALIKDGFSFKPSDSTIVQLFRYTFVGGLAFIVDFLSLWIITDIFDVHYLISAGIAFLLGLTTNYLLSISWVFHKRTYENPGVEFAIFLGVGLAGLLFNELFMWLFTDIAGIYYLGSKILSTFFVYLWNFGMRKLMLFR